MTYFDRRLARTATLAGAATFALLTLAACGGGGGSGPTSMMPPGEGQMPGGGSTTIPTRAEALTDPVTAANAAVKIAQAALAQPAPGSVTQSSNVDSSNISIDQVEITAQYGSGGPSFSVRNGTAWSISTSDGNPSRISGTPPPWQGVELGKRIADGTLYVDAYTDIEAPTPGTSGQPVNVRAGDRIVITVDSGFGSQPSFQGTRNGVPGTFTADPNSFDGAFSKESETGRFDEVEGMLFIPDGSGSPQQMVGVGDAIAFTGGVPDDGPDYVNGQRGTRNGVPGTFRCSANCSWDYTASSITGYFSEVRGLEFVADNGGGTPTANDADYLAGGIWLIVPDDAASAADYQFGAFADGSDPFLQSNLAAVTGTATYTGDATGVYSAKEAGGITGGFLDADVRLTANFGDANGLGTINGSLTNFALDGTPVPGALNLGTANIGAQNSGFFRGAVTGADDERSYTGHWGGQFFGNGEADGRPGSVAGTFGGHSTDDVVSFVGAFGAHKQ